MTIKAWEIWYASVKFEDSDEVKQRPVLVIDPQRNFVMALKMTGMDRGDEGSEYRVRDWNQAGLSKPTFIRLGKYLKLRQQDFDKKIGELSAQDKLLVEFRLTGR